MLPGVVVSTVETEEDNTTPFHVLAFREWRTQNVAFNEESCGKNHTIYVYLTYKDDHRS